MILLCKPHFVLWMRSIFSDFHSQNALWESSQETKDGDEKKRNFKRHSILFQHFHILFHLLARLGFTTPDANRFDIHVWYLYIKKMQQIHMRMFLQLWDLNWNCLKIAQFPWALCSFFYFNNDKFKLRQTKNSTKHD